MNWRDQPIGQDAEGETVRRCPLFNATQTIPPDREYWLDESQNVLEQLWSRPLRTSDFGWTGWHDLPKVSG